MEELEKNRGDFILSFLVYCIIKIDFINEIEFVLKIFIEKLLPYNVKLAIIIQ